MKQITEKDISKILRSVICVKTDLYPDEYPTDRTFFNMISHIMNERGHSKTGGVVSFDVSYNTILKCIDESCGLSGYVKEFGDNFDISKGIGRNYDALVSRYSSPEIVLLCGLFPNLSYMHFNIHLGKDMRESRKKYMTCLNVPDLSIDTISIKLRDYMSQNLVDDINKYVVDYTGFDDNVMSKKNTFMTNNIGEFFDFIASFCSTTGNDQLYDELYSLFGFLDIEEIRDSAMIMVTDWPVL